MPYRRLANSVPSALRHLTKARDTYKNTPVAADRALSAEQFALVDDTLPTSLLNRLIKEATDVDLAEAAQAPITDALALADGRLRMFHSHFHQGLDHGILRGTFAAGARSYYGRDVGATSIPDPADADELAADTLRIVTGEADRAAAEGAAYVPMGLPSAAEVAAVRTTFNTLRLQQQQATIKTNREREEVLPVLTEALPVCKDFAETAEYFFRKDTNDASRRQKCEQWGVNYIFEPNEPGAPPASPEPPANPPA